MTTTTLSSRQFNQDVSRAKRAANDGPVINYRSWEPAYVLLKHDDYRRLAGDEPSIAICWISRVFEDIDFDPPRLGDGIFRPASLA